MSTGLDQSMTESAKGEADSPDDPPKDGLVGDDPDPNDQNDSDDDDIGMVLFQRPVLVPAKRKMDDDRPSDDVYWQQDAIAVCFDIAVHNHNVSVDDDEKRFAVTGETGNANKNPKVWYSWEAPPFDRAAGQSTPDEEGLQMERDLVSSWTPAILAVPERPRKELASGGG